MAARIIAPERYVRYMEAARTYCFYPPIARYSGDFDEAAYRAGAGRSNDDLMPRPLAVYVHLPFCKRGCFYCTCPKAVATGAGDPDAYLRALAHELTLQSALFDRDRDVEYVHWLGCTVGALDNGGLAAVHTTLRQNYGGNSAPDCGIELDPRDITPGLMPRLRDQGFTRISLGVQAFSTADQTAANQAFNGDAVVAAIAAARREGMKTVTVELVCGLPGQSTGEFVATAGRLLALKPDRIAIHDHGEGAPTPPVRPESLARRAELFLEAAKHILDAGYVHIGRGCFTRSTDPLTRAFEAGSLQFGYYGYYTGERRELIGAGLGAITEVGAVCEQHYADAADYHHALSRGRLPVASGLVLSDEDLLRRDVVVRLLARSRVDYRVLEERYRISFDHFFARERVTLEAMAADGLLKLESDALVVTPEGRFVLPAICTVFEQTTPPSARIAHFPRIL